MNVCMPAYTFYESDNRVRRYAETLAARGDEVDVFSLKRPGQKKYDMLNGVNIYRIQERIHNEKGKFDYLYRLLKFYFKSMLVMTSNHLKKRYDLVHVHSVPDFEVFAALFVKILGAKIILDIHDLVPEFYNSKFGTDKDSGIYNVMIFIEKISCSFSDHVIISNHIWFNTLTERSVSKDKCTVILNYPDQKIFYQRKRKRIDGKFIMIYPGSLNWHQGLDVAIDAFHRISSEIPQAEFHIYGKGPLEDKLHEMVKERKLEDRILIKGGRPLDEIASIMSECDVGIIPKRNDSFGGEAFSTKSLEFMSLGVPLVISKTKIDSYYFNESVVRFFKSEDVNSLSSAMLELNKDDSLRKKLSDNALKFVANFSWDLKKQEYLNIVDNLVVRN